MKEVLPPHARVADALEEYLGAVEAGNAPDREAFLARHPDLAEALAAALDGLDFVRRAAGSLAEAKSEEALAGQALGDYRLLRELGRGGMAVVYEAEQVSLGRHVALKVLPFAAVLDSKHLQRFKNEAMAAAHLHHKNIVPVYGVGCERGVHYYAMQYVEGQSLAHAIAELKGGGGLGSSDDTRPGSAGEGPRTPISSHGSNREPAYIRMGAALGVQAAEALDHAHQLGIVHRDVKPGNLLVDHAGTLWITDFGLSSSIKDVGLTITGELLGTIRYMSPEQALAKRVPIDHRTDVYSLGATLYELFTLEPAFPGDDAHVVMRDIASREPVPPRRLNPALPRDLETVLLKAMSKDPGGRYATAQEMADDLGRFLENRAIEAKRPGPFRRVVKWSRRHRALVGTAAGVLLLAVAGLTTGTALLWREQENTRTAFERADANFKRADANLALALEALDQIYVDEAEGHPKIREGLPKDLLARGLGFYEKFAKENAHNQDVAFLMARAHHRAGLIFRALGQEDRAKEALDRAIAAYDRAIEIDPRHAVVHTNRGVALQELGRFEEALAAFDRAIEIDPRFAGAHISRGHQLRYLGRFEESLAACDRAVEIDPRSALAHNNCGIALRDLGRVEEALAACDRAIEIDPRFALPHNNRGNALRDLGRMKEALAEFDRAIELDPRSALAHNNRGVALRDLGRVEEALAACDRAIEIDPRDALAHNSRGALLLDNLGRPGEALAEFDRAIELDARGVADASSIDRGSPVSTRSSAHTNRGSALRDLGRLEEALAACDRAIEIDPRFAGAHYNRGITLQVLGRVEEALAAYDRAIELDARFAPAHNNRGVLLIDHLGRPGEALAACDRAIEIDPRSAQAHDSRGAALGGLGRLEEALAACDRAIEIDSRCAGAHKNRGALLCYLGRPGEALAACDRAIEIDPRFADAHNNRGTALLKLGRVEEALAACDRAIEIDPRFAGAHYNRGKALEAKGEAEAAIGAYCEAIRLRPDFAEAYCNLGQALMRQGHLQEALPWLRKGHEIGSKRPGWAYPSKRWVDSAELQAELEDRLDRVLSGERGPRDAVERIEFALLLYRKARHAESARMYAEAFAEDAALVEDLAKGHRYNAACSASLEAARGGADAAEWRGRALEWLRADLAAREKAPSGLVATLEHWKQDADLAAVRDCLEELPEPEREAWRSLWAAVDRALAAARSAAK